MGSSARMIEGRFTRARAIATRWRWPPESSFGLWWMRSPRPTLSRVSRGPLAALRRRDARVDEGQLDVLQGVRAGKEVEGLEDEPDLPVADVGQLVVHHRRHVLPVELVLARGRRVQAAEHVHQGRLAGAGRPHDREVLVAVDAERDAAQGVDRLLAHLVELGHALDRDDQGTDRAHRAGLDWGQGRHGGGPYLLASVTSGFGFSILILAPSLRVRLIAA